MSHAERAERITSLRTRARRLRDDLMAAASCDGPHPSDLAEALREAAHRIDRALPHIERAVVLARFERRAAGEKAIQ